MAAAALLHHYRGLEKFGGRLLLSSHVTQVTTDSSGRATGVTLRGGSRITARRGVISNASVWDTLQLLPEGVAPPEWRKKSADTPKCPSFMHLHLGFDATGECG
jgi:phytoene dehydrogenase-like protein